MKIFHISDLHFGYHQDSIITSFLQEISTFNPDLVILSGDLTHRAKSSEYRLLADFLHQIPCAVMAVPGNHDIPLYRIWTRLFFPYSLYKKHVSPTLYCEYQNDAVRVLGVNSVNPARVKSGQLSVEVLQKILHYFSPEFEGCNILFFHHNFDYLAGYHKPLKNSRQFIDYLKKSSVHMVCTGHLHYANVSEIKKDASPSCLNLHGGSLSCERSKDNTNSYYSIEIHQKKGTITWRTFNGSEFQTGNRQEMDFNQG